MCGLVAASSGSACPRAGRPAAGPFARLGPSSNEERGAVRVGVQSPRTVAACPRGRRLLPLKPLPLTWPWGLPPPPACILHPSHGVPLPLPGRAAVVASSPCAAAMPWRYRSRRAPPSRPSAYAPEGAVAAGAERRWRGAAPSAAAGWAVCEGKPSADGG